MDERTYIGIWKIQKENEDIEKGLKVANIKNKGNLLHWL